MSTADHSVERSVLAAALADPEALAWALVEDRIAPDTFDHGVHRALWTAIVTVHDAGDPVDALTVRSAVSAHRGPDGDPVDLQGAVQWIASKVEVPTNGALRAHTRRLRELAALRRDRLAAAAMLTAADAGDREALAQAKDDLLALGDVSPEASRTPEAVADLLIRYVSSPPEDAWKLPWENLTRRLAGGLRRGQVTLLGGWSSHGKSVICDQVLEEAARQGANTHLYINEMRVEERGLRYVARRAGLDFARLLAADLPPERWATFTDAAATIPYGITNAADWTAVDVAHHARRNGFDFIAVDILHEFDYDDERDLRAIMRAFTRLSKVANCHVLAVVHLNEARASGSLPPPVPRDVKGASALRQAADNVLFVHRDQSIDGTVIEDTGSLYLAKARNGVTGGLPVVFDGAAMRFTPEAF